MKIKIRAYDENLRLSVSPSAWSIEKTTLKRVFFSLVTTPLLCKYIEAKPRNFNIRNVGIIMTIKQYKNEFIKKTLPGSSSSCVLT